MEKLESGENSELPSSPENEIPRRWIIIREGSQFLRHQCTVVWYQRVAEALVTHLMVTRKERERRGPTHWIDFQLTSNHLPSSN